MNLAARVKDVPDFPKPGILFKDITPLLADAGAFKDAVGRIARYGRRAGARVVAAVESRGFIIGAAVAREMGVGFVPVRKKGKLPRRTVRVRYALEYGTDTLEIHADAVRRGDRVLLVDDVLATGGTAAAACRLLEKLGARVAGVAFLIELGFLKGAAKLDGRGHLALIRY